MKISNWKIKTKLLFLVGVLATVIAIVAAVGLVGVSNIIADNKKIVEMGHESLLGARVNQNVVALSRAEYRVAADPSDDTVRFTQNLVAEQRRLLEERLATLKSAGDAEQINLLAEVEKNYKTYIVDQDVTFEKVRQLGAKIQQDDARKTILDAVKTSRTASDALQKSVREYVELTDKQSQDISTAAEKTSSRVEITMIVLSIAGILGGIVFGYLLLLRSTTFRCSPRATCRPRSSARSGAMRSA